MGIGDQIIGTGLARGAAARGKRIAFGDKARIIWDGNSRAIFHGNPNIAPPGSELAPDLEWIPYYKGHRMYNRAAVGRWEWNYGFHVRPGELPIAGERRDNLVLLEPNVPRKDCAPNKQWPAARWQQLAELLTRAGYEVRQFEYGRPYRVAPVIETKSFLDAAIWLKRARLAILPEGGLHHAAAAVGCPAVVLFGGFAPPQVLGYKSHANLTGGAEACGSFGRCMHCAEAMDRISVADVLEASERFL